MVLEFVERFLFVISSSRKLLRRQVSRACGNGNAPVWELTLEKECGSVCVEIRRHDNEVLVLFQTCQLFPAHVLDQHVSGQMYAHQVARIRTEWIERDIDKPKLAEAYNQTRQSQTPALVLMAEGKG